MLPLLAQFWNRLFRLLLKRIILALTLLFCIGAGIAMANMSQLSTTLIEAQARQNAALYAQSFQQAIDLYSESAAERARTVKGVNVTHAYLNQKGAIPLPSTFALELGDRISERNTEMSVRLFSDYPFPWRKEKGGLRDEIDKEALTALRQSPKKPFVRFDRQNGHTTLFYGEASIMKASCVACHNTDPNSPKKDWEVGDVAGVWGIRQPLDQFIEQVDKKLRGMFVGLGGISLLGLSGLTLVVGRLRQTARELEQRVRERTADLAQANTDLEKRNQLIRQVFGRYLSDSVVGTLLDQPMGLKLGGDRRTITILTSDLRGFSTLSERLPPEDVIQILNLYLEDMAEVINQYQGTIDEFMGDGILVLFGAPVSQSDHALRAVACACAMQLAMGAVNEKLHAMGLMHLEMGIGINTGDVIVGNIGSERRTKYGIVGSSVNLTYRIESYTKGGQILISEPTLQAAGQSVKIAGQQHIQPKGFQRSFTIYEVCGVSGRYNLFLPKSVDLLVPSKPLAMEAAIEDSEPQGLPKGEPLLKPLSTAVPISFVDLQDRKARGQRSLGSLIKLAPQGAEIWVESASHLPAEGASLKLNLMTETAAQAGNDMVAQVVSVEPSRNCFCIQFTSVPPLAQAWLDALI